MTTLVHMSRVQKELYLHYNPKPRNTIKTVGVVSPLKSPRHFLYSVGYIDDEYYNNNNPESQHTKKQG